MFLHKAFKTADSMPCFNFIAGQCRTNNVTNGTKLNLMPECRCQTETDDYGKKCYDAASDVHGVSILTGSIMVVQGVSLSKAVWKCRAYLFSPPTSGMDVQGVLFNII